MAATTWKISYPEKFIAEIEHYPAIKHDRQSQQIQANTKELRTTFQYEKIEEGCYLFMVDMEALEDTKIAILGDRAHLAQVFRGMTKSVRGLVF